MPSETTDPIDLTQGDINSNGKGKFDLFADNINSRSWVDDRLGAPQCGLPPTPRELEVFRTIVEFGGEKQAAYHLGLSQQTVKNHMTTLYARLRVHNQLAALWVLYPILHDAVEHGPPMREERRSGYDRRVKERRDSLR